MGDLINSGFNNLINFAFRKDDVGQYKSEVAAKFVMKRCPGVKITHYTTKIQEFDLQFYKQFHCIIAGLDNIEARRWLNSMVHTMVEFEEDGSIVEGTQISLIDGGTEGFKGQSRVIIPFKTGCFECSMGTIPPAVSYPACTIANTPRIPEHCIAYALVMQWPTEFPSRAVDKDSPVDMKWLYDRALERANTFGIQGVTYKLTMGVVKNIIPAIASTNALVSAHCVTEAIKSLSGCNHTLDNYFQYMGQTGLSTQTFVFERSADCVVCNKVKKTIEVSSSITLRALIETLVEKFRLTGPSIDSNKGPIYIAAPPSIEVHHAFKLDLTLKQLAILQFNYYKNLSESIRFYHTLNMVKLYQVTQEFAIKKLNGKFFYYKVIFDFIMQLTEKGIMNDGEYQVIDKAIPSAINLIIKYTD